MIIIILIIVWIGWLYWYNIIRTPEIKIEQSGDWWFITKNGKPVKYTASTNEAQVKQYHKIITNYNEGINKFL